MPNENNQNKIKNVTLLLNALKSILFMFLTKPESDEKSVSAGKLFQTLTTRSVNKKA